MLRKLRKRKCFGIRLSPILIVLSVFTISLAIGAYVRRCRIPEEDRFVAGFKDFLTGDCKVFIEWTNNKK